jgi:hypothetical protein
MSAIFTKEYDWKSAQAKRAAPIGVGRRALDADSMIRL